MLIIDIDNRWFIDNVKCIILQLFGKKKTDKNGSLTGINTLYPKIT